MTSMTNKTNKNPIKLNKEQDKAARALLKGLKANLLDDTNCTKLLHDLLHSLYAPQDTSLYVSNVFSSPVVAFLALICKTPQGSYNSLEKIASDMAMIQTCIRLRCFGHMMGGLQNVAAQDIKDINDDWVEYV